MIVLSLETSTPRSSVCIAGRDGPIASASLEGPQRHAEFVATAIRFCLAEAGVDAAAVSGVAVGLGPGLFTGLRVGIATAQAFAYARMLPVVGLSGLDVMAFRHRHVRGLVCAALDARRGEVFWAFYRPVPGGVQRMSELRVGPPARLGAEIEAASEECLVIGDGGTRYREVLEDFGADVAGRDGSTPDAADLAELAVHRFVREETQRPAELAPIYLRSADARIGWETMGRMRGGTSG